MSNHLFSVTNPFIKTSCNKENEPINRNYTLTPKLKSNNKNKNLKLNNKEKSNSKNNILSILKTIKNDNSSNQSLTVEMQQNFGKKEKHCFSDNVSYNSNDKFPNVSAILSDVQLQRSSKTTIPKSIQNANKTKSLKKNKDILDFFSRKIDVHNTTKTNNSNNHHHHNNNNDNEKNNKKVNSEPNQKDKIKNSNKEEEEEEEDAELPKSMEALGNFIETKDKALKPSTNSTITKIKPIINPKQEVYPQSTPFPEKNPLQDEINNNTHFMDDSDIPASAIDFLSKSFDDSSQKKITNTKEKEKLENTPNKTFMNTHTHKTIPKVKKEKSETTENNSINSLIQKKLENHPNQNPAKTSVNTNPFSNYPNRPQGSGGDDHGFDDKENEHSEEELSFPQPTEVFRTSLTKSSKEKVITTKNHSSLPSKKDLSSISTNSKSSTKSSNISSTHSFEKSFFKDSKINDMIEGNQEKHSNSSISSVEESTETSFPFIHTKTSSVATPTEVKKGPEEDSDSDLDSLMTSEELFKKLASEEEDPPKDILFNKKTKKAQEVDPHHPKSYFDVMKQNTLPLVDPKKREPSDRNKSKVMHGQGSHSEQLVEPKDNSHPNSLKNKDYHAKPESKRPNPAKPNTKDTNKKKKKKRMDEPLQKKLNSSLTKSKERHKKLKKPSKKPSLQQRLNFAKSEKSPFGDPHLNNNNNNNANTNTRMKDLVQDIRFMEEYMKKQNRDNDKLELIKQSIQISESNYRHPEDPKDPTKPPITGDANPPHGDFLEQTKPGHDQSKNPKDDPKHPPSLIQGSPNEGKRNKRKPPEEEDELDSDFMESSPFTKKLKINPNAKEEMNSIAPDPKHPIPPEKGEILKKKEEEEEKEDLEYHEQFSKFKQIVKDFEDDEYDESIFNFDVDHLIHGISDAPEPIKRKISLEDYFKRGKLVSLKKRYIINNHYNSQGDKATFKCPYCKFEYYEDIEKDIYKELQQFLEDHHMKKDGEILTFNIPLIKQYEFCRLHQAKLVIIPEGIKKGYPLQIDFDLLKTRIYGFKEDLFEIVYGRKSSYFRALALSEYKRLGVNKARNSNALMNRFEKILVGYYGSRGFHLMTEILQDMFFVKTRSIAKEEPNKGKGKEEEPEPEPEPKAILGRKIEATIETTTLTSDGDRHRRSIIVKTEKILTYELSKPQEPFEYIQEVLVPECGIRLIAEDHHLDKEKDEDLAKARKIMEESNDFGLVVHEYIDTEN